MPRAVVVLPSTTYRAGDFVSAAESLGIDLVVASEQPPPFDMGENYLQIDCSDPARSAAAVAALGDDVPLDGVVAADDAGVVVAAIAGTSLGLRANTRVAAAATRDKGLLRDRLASAEVSQPRFALVGPDEDAAAIAATIGFPLVAKPLSRSASQGVIRVDSSQELGPTLQRIRRIIAEPGAVVMIEEYVGGAEVAVEGLVRDGELTVLAIFDKPDTRTGPSFPETIMVTPSRLPAQTLVEIVRVTESALRAIGIAHGPVHVELKADGARVVVIEVAARSIGGLCSRTLSFGLMGTTLESLILRNAIGLDKPELKRTTHASGVLMIPIPGSGALSGIGGIEATKTIEGVTGIDIMIRPGDHVLAPPEGDRYLGFVYARGRDPGQVEEALRQAMDTISVEIEATPQQPSGSS